MLYLHTSLFYKICRNQITTRVSFEEIQTQPWHVFKNSPLADFYLLINQTTFATNSLFCNRGRRYSLATLSCSFTHIEAWNIINLISKQGKKRWMMVTVRSRVSFWQSTLGWKKKWDKAYDLAHCLIFLFCPSRHPVIRKWPRSYEWFFMKMNIEHVWLQSWYGGVSTIAVEEYLKAVPSKAWLNGLWSTALSFLNT